MTTQPQHTLGDWTAHGCTVYSGDVAVALAYVEHVREDIPDLMPALTWDEAYSNAALIAAAPDLLAALEAAADALEAVGALGLLQDDGRSIGETISAALAKARAGQ